MMKFSSQIAWTVHQTGQTVWRTIDTIDLTQQGCVTDVLCRWVSQTYMSYSSMSEYICGSEWVVLFITQNRRMTADKWIRSVTVTVASAALIHRTCVCVCVRVLVVPGQNGVFVHHDAALTFDITSTDTCTHTSLFWHILSLQTQLLSSFLHCFLYCEILINKYTLN